jgi:hypothetical protein
LIDDVAQLKQACTICPCTERLSMKWCAPVAEWSLLQTLLACLLQAIKAVKPQSSTGPDQSSLANALTPATAAKHGSQTNDPPKLLRV